MSGISVCLNTQTPLVQFLGGTETAPRVWPREVTLERLREGVDYRFSPGGVTRMVFPLVRWLTAHGKIREAHWVSLNPTGPETIHVGPLTLHHLRLRPHRMAGYGRTKEAIWGTIHGLNAPGDEAMLFWSDSFAEYSYYNRQTAERIRALDRVHDFDLFYIHDFQQMPVGEMLGSVKPKILRWHIPFDATILPEEWQAVLVRYLNAYDTVVVSTDRYSRSLRSFGFEREVHRIYPYVDPSEYGHPSPRAVTETAAKFGLGRDHEVVLVVARMDPAKGQDRAIRAFAEVGARRPRLRLVLVGNGSFSASTGGLGLSKGAQWRSHLENLASELGVADRVIATGHVTQAELDALYERARCTILPSTNEGFGLVVVESWLHGRPTIVTDRAGVSELIEDGKNGLLFDPDHPEQLAAQLRRLLRAPLLGRRLAEEGRATARRCSLEAAAKAEGALLHRLVEA